MLAPGPWKGGKRPLKWIIVCCIHIILFSGLSLYCMKLRLMFLLKKGISKTMIFLMCVMASAAWLFCVICLGRSGLNNRSHMHIRRCIRDIDEVLKDMDFVATGGLSASKYYMAFVKTCMFLYVVLAMCTIAVHVLTDDVTEISEFLHFPECLATFLLMYEMFMLYALAQYLIRRYTYLLHTTETLMEEMKLPENMIIRRIKRLQKLVRCLYHMVEGINEVFGWYIFLCVVITVFGCLYSMSYVLSYHKVGRIKIGPMYDIFGECALFLISTVIIVMTLDRVEKVGSKLPKAAYMVTRKTENEEILEELNFLSKYAKELKPKFLAGYFKVDRHLLSSSLSAISTYIIVIIQFSATSIKTIVIEDSNNSNKTI